MNLLVIGAIIIAIAIGAPIILWTIEWMAIMADKPQDGERVYSPTLVKARGRKQ